MKICYFAAIAASVVLISGCDSVHKGTKVEKNLAVQRLEGIKAATEFEIAKQSYLGGDLDKSFKAINRSIALNANMPKSYILRGRIQLEQGDLEGSILSFQQAEKVDEKSVEAQYYQGLVAERINHSEEALVFFTKAADLDPQNAQYVIAAAETLIDLNKVEEAAAFLKSRGDKFQHNPGVRQTLGHLAMIQNHPEIAVSQFSEARLLAPEDTGIVEDLLHAQMEVGQFADAEYNLQRLLKTEKGKARRDLKHLRAECLVKVDRLMDARELFIQLTSGAEGQADVEGWIGLGNVSYMLKDNGRLKLAAARTIAVAPNRSEGYVLRALYQRRLGDLNSAQINLHQALGYKADGETYLLLAIVQDELKQTDEAKQTLSTLLKLDPNNAQARQLLGTIGQPVAAVSDR